MDNIEKALQYAETGEMPKDDLNPPMLIYEAIDKLRGNAKYFLDWYSATTEFRRAKLMRANNIPMAASDDDKQILVNIA